VYLFLYLGYLQCLKAEPEFVSWWFRQVTSKTLQKPWSRFLSLSLQQKQTGRDEVECWAVFVEKSCWRLA
jgi:hypothetical protein